MTRIEESVFDSCSALEEVVLPASITKIDRRAFFACITLEEITIPDSVTDIGAGAFGNCISLKEIIIPDGVTNIGELAFRGCDSLTQVTINGHKPPECGENIFLQSDRLTAIYVPAGTADAYSEVLKEQADCIAETSPIKVTASQTVDDTPLEIYAILAIFTLLGYIFIKDTKVKIR